ncbi:MAG: alpha-galactosidase [Lentisphaeria bacterium]|jgi:alpha-galactosidase|nr:alpha-galactosidase [Lentisphaeria bacterium]
MPALRFTAADKPAAFQLADCLGLAARPPQGNDPFLDLRGEEISAPMPEAAGDDTYCRRYANGLRAETRFEQIGEKVWQRRDTLRNEGASEVVLTELASRFDLARGEYELYSQAGGWCGESQGGWQALTHGSREFFCEHGRTTQNSTPFLAVRCVGNDAGVAFHLLPRGNWRIAAYTLRDAGWQAPSLTLRFGPHEPDGFRLVLQPGEEYALPAIVLVAFPAERIEAAAPPLHTALASSLPAFSQPPPLAYNTWFESFADLDVANLHRQVAAAADVGCEVFVVDAGWYGAGEGWACQGDWREKTDRAFRGRMADFADHVRAAGLGFGLWMESEAVHPSTPLGQNPPSWLRRGPSGMFWPDLVQPEARAWVRDEISRLLDTYQAVWLKIDFNQPIGPDPRRVAMRGYYDAWYDLLDELRGRFPQTFFENCASGAMRLDLESYRHFHGHFLSDTVHPVDNIRLAQGTFLRIPPGGIYTWAVLGPGGSAPHYPAAARTAPPSAITPCDAMWHRTEKLDVGFVLASALPGMIGLSGNLADLAPSIRQDMRRWTSLWKEHRNWLRHSRAHLLTPVRHQLDNTGWAVFEYADDDHALVLAFRLRDPNPRCRLRLQSPAPDARYILRRLDGKPEETRTGRELLADGLDFQVPAVFGVAVAVLERQPG